MGTEACLMLWTLLIAKANLSSEIERFAPFAEEDWNLDSKMFIWQSFPIFWRKWLIFRANTTKILPYLPKSSSSNRSNPSSCANIQQLINFCLQRTGHVILYFQCEQTVEKESIFFLRLLFCLEVTNPPLVYHKGCPFFLSAVEEGSKTKLSL